MSDQVARAFNWIDAQIAKFRRGLEQQIERNVSTIERCAHHTSSAAKEAIAKAEEKHTGEVAIRWAIERQNVTNNAIKIFKLPKNSAAQIQEYFESKMMENV